MLAVIVLVVDVWVMRMGMCQRRMGVRMRMRFAPVSIVHVLVVRVVHVAVCMRHRLVGMQVFVAFSQVQPHSRTH